MGGELVVTENWIEKSLEESHLVDPSDNILFQPLTFRVPLPGSDTVFFGITGYDSLDRLHLSRLCLVLKSHLLTIFRHLDVSIARNSLKRILI
jgi:hypothetical protein